MLTRTMSTGLLLIFIGFVMALSHGVVFGGEMTDQEEFETVTNQILALSTTLNVSQEERQNRVRQLEAMSQEIEQDWGNRDIEKYGRLMNTLTGRIGGMDVSAGLRDYLAQKMALQALEKADKMPLDVHCDLLRGARRNVGQGGKPLAGNAWAELRKSLATLQLAGWQRIDKTIDENWDPNDTGVLNVSPPDGANANAGVAPEAIADPNLRAEYERAIEINRQKIARATLQRKARDLKKYWIPGVERFLIKAYMDDPDRLEELEVLLSSYIEDEAKRSRILDAVKEKKMPEDLVIRNTTQPTN